MQDIDRRLADGAGSPAVADRASVPDIEGDRDPRSPVARHERGHERRIVERGRPHDRAGGPHVQDPRDRVTVAQPARDLHRRVVAYRVEDRADGRELGRGAITGAVQVHDVQPPCARVDEPARDGDWMVRKHGLAGEVALAQTHDAPASKVDRRQQRQRGCHVVPSVVAL